VNGVFCVVCPFAGDEKLKTTGDEKLKTFMAI